jgi:hypothetical protein
MLATAKSRDVGTGTVIFRMADGSVGDGDARRILHLYDGNNSLADQSNQKGSADGAS